MSTPLEIVVKSDIGNVVADQQELQQSLAKTATAAQKTDSSLSKISTGLSSIGSKSQVATTALSSIGQAAGGAASDLANLGQGLLTGGIVVAIPLLIEGLQSLIEYIYDVSDAQKALNETLENSQKAFVKASATVNELTTEIDLAKKGFLNKDDVVKHYNETIGKTAGLVKTVEEAETQLIAKGPAYIQLMILKASANYAYAKSAEFLVQSMVASTQNKGTGLVADAVENITKRLQKQSDIFKSLGQQFTEQAGVLSKQFGLDFFSGITPEKPIKEAKEKIVKHVRDIEDVLNELNRQILVLNTLELNIKTDESMAKISAIKGAISELIKKFGLDGSSTQVKKLLIDIQFIQQKQILDNFISPGKITAESLKKPITVDINVKPKIHFIPPNDLDKDAERFLQDINSMISGLAVEALSGIGEVIGKAISGGDISGAFSSLFQKMGAGIKQLGQYLIQYYVKLQAIKSLGNTNPALGIALGVALTALGTIIQSKTAKGPAFATGTRNFSGGQALVGERGPELLTLPSGSSITPNAQLRAMNNTGADGYILETLLRGQDMRILLKRADAANRRNS